MAYYAIKDDDGNVLSFGMTMKASPYSITEAEYNQIKTQHDLFCSYVIGVYSGSIAIDDVPEEYREKVSAEVEKMRKAEAEKPEYVDPVDEALSILHGEVSA